MNTLISWINFLLELYLKRNTYYACLYTDSNDTFTVVIHASVYIRIRRILQQHQHRNECGGILRITVPKSFICQRFGTKYYDSENPQILLKAFCLKHNVEWMDFIEPDSPKK